MDLIFFGEQGKKKIEDSVKNDNKWNHIFSFLELLFIIQIFKEYIF